MRIQRNKLMPMEGKIWVDVYSYVVQRCKERNDELIIEVNGEEMIVPPEQLRLGKKLTKQKFVSKFGGKDYYLISFPWRPTKAEDDLKRYLI